MEPGDGNGEEKAPVAGRDPETGQFTKGYKGGPGRKGKKRTVPVEGVPLPELMARVLTEQMSEAELRKLLRESPADYRRLMELAQRAAAVPAGVGDGPRDSDESHVRKVIDELIEWMRYRTDAGPHPS